MLHKRINIDNFLKDNTNFYLEIANYLIYSDYGHFVVKGNYVYFFNGYKDNTGFIKVHTDLFPHSESYMPNVIYKVKENSTYDFERIMTEDLFYQFNSLNIYKGEQEKCKDFERITKVGIPFIDNPYTKEIFLDVEKLEKKLKNSEKITIYNGNLNLEQSAFSGDLEEGLFVKSRRYNSAIQERDADLDIPRTLHPDRIDYADKETCTVQFTTESCLEDFYKVGVETPHLFPLTKKHEKIQPYVLTDKPFDSKCVDGIPKVLTVNKDLGSWLLKRMIKWDESLSFTRKEPMFERSYSNLLYNIREQGSEHPSLTLLKKYGLAYFIDNYQEMFDNNKSFPWGFPFLHDIFAKLFSDLIYVTLHYLAGKDIFKIDTFLHKNGKQTQVGHLYLYKELYRYLQEVYRTLFIYYHDQVGEYKGSRLLAKGRSYQNGLHHFIEEELFNVFNVWETKEVDGVVYNYKNVNDYVTIMY